MIEPSGRWAGVLLHPTSLPGRFGIGDLGPAAVTFLDWLRRAGQSVWQMLPVGPTESEHSPYGSPSAFAGNALLISPEWLREEDLLAAADLDEAPELPAGAVAFGAVLELKTRLLRRAFERFEAGAAAALREPFEAWPKEPGQAPWLDDWTLFAALRRRDPGCSWTAWPEPLRRRELEALAAARRELAAEVRFERFVQFLFDRQWTRLRAEARARGIGLLGDLPIYLSGDAADLWAHPELFALDADLQPEKVAGVPPDYFSADGQLWGNPLYRWEHSAATGHAWWVERLRLNLHRFDFVRLDHFRAFSAYWELPAGAPNARDGQWVDGPRASLFEAFRAAFGERLPLVAEDLGAIDEPVHELRRAFGLPGMKVLQFGFLPASSDHLPHRLERATVLYTGTHDNDTAMGFLAQLAEEDRRRALDYLGVESEGFPRALLRAAYASVAQLAIVPLQDLLGLGSEARMNTPGIAAGNWSWRLLPGQLDALDPTPIHRLAELTERIPAPPDPPQLEPYTPASDPPAAAPPRP